jgi:predicted acetyltransferase
MDLLPVMDDNHAAHRRRGHAAALTAAGMRLAAEAGYATAVLQASGAGQRVYERFGFRVAGRYVEHAIR